MVKRHYDKGALSVSKEGIEKLLAKNPTENHKLARARALLKLAEDIAHFCHWPALEESLAKDAERLLINGKRELKL